MINSFGELSPQEAGLASFRFAYEIIPRRNFASDEPGANDESQRIAVARLYHRTIRREAPVRPISQMDGCAKVQKKTRPA